MDKKVQTPIKRIELLISSLPKKDIPIGTKYLKDRNFEALQMLVDSAIIRVKRGLHSENPKQEYLEVDIRTLNELKVEVDNYYSAQYYISDIDEI